ncbi:MAG TPA: xylulokinase [Candidatus Latescibacteria bacterium]|nr:xylulokinase [Candidatus Latescibacterota bacterium]
MGLLLGLDIGTTGVKALVIDDSGHTLGRHTVEYPLLIPKPGWAEQDPATWWTATITAIGSVLAEAGVKGADIAGIGLSGQMHSSVFLDEHDEVIRPALLWCDGRTTKQRYWITERVGGDAEMRRLVSNPPLEGFTLPKVIWLRDEEPANFRRLKTLLLPKDYVRFRLTGEKLMEVADASGTAMFDVANRVWSEELMRKVDLPMDILVPVRESVAECGRISRDVAAMTGLREGIPVAGGGGDNACGAVGTGIVREGRVLASLGTSGVVFAHTDTVKVDPDLRAHTNCHSVPNRWCLMGVMLSAGGSLRWLRDVVADSERASAIQSGRDPYDVMAEEAAKAPIGSEGLVFLPYLSGERTPHRDANARGAFVGLSLRHGREHLMRCVFEGITFGMRDSLSIMRELGLHISEIRATGGGARSAFWRQMQADVYGVPVVTVNASEGPAFGAALMGGVCSGMFSDLADASDALVKIVSVAVPIPSNVSRYEEWYERYRALYPALKQEFANVATMVEKHSQ